MEGPDEVEVIKSIVCCKTHQYTAKQILGNWNLCGISGTVSVKEVDRTNRTIYCNCNIKIGAYFKTTAASMVTTIYHCFEYAFIALLLRCGLQRIEPISSRAPFLAVVFATPVPTEKNDRVLQSWLILLGCSSGYYYLSSIVHSRCNFCFLYHTDSRRFNPSRRSSIRNNAELSMLLKEVSTARTAKAHGRPLHKHRYP